MTQQAPSKATGDAVLQTAIQMEELGRDFYKALAAATREPKVRDLCVKLADAELKHRQTFQEMRSGLACQGKTVLLPAHQLAAARQAARGTVLPDPDAIRQMASQGDLRALLDLAVQMEKDSIGFYRSFSDSAPDRAVVEAIILEEQKHLQLLTAANWMT